MPKKMTKTAAIREALKKHESPKVVAGRLQKQGYDVSAAYVSTIKSAEKRRAEAGTQRAGRPKKPENSGTQDPQAVVELLDLAVDLVVRCGSEKEAKKLVSTAAVIVDKAT